MNKDKKLKDENMNDKDAIADLGLNIPDFLSKAEQEMKEKYGRDFNFDESNANS